MRKRGILLVIASVLCLAIGAACHGLRTSGEKSLFIVGAVIGVLMIICALSFAVSGMIMIFRSKKG